MLFSVLQYSRVCYKNVVIFLQARAPSAASEKLPSPSTELPDMEIPEPPKLPSPERTESLIEGTMSNTALVSVFFFFS